MKKFLFRIAAILSLLIGMAIPAHALPPAPVTGAPATGIRVLVYGIHHGGNMVYNYKVINNGDTPFNNFTIGSYFKSEEDGELPQLIRLPLGWSYGRTGETGTAIIIAPASTSQPPYWTPHVFGQQENDNYYLKWHASRGPGDVSNSIRPGQTLTGFSVTVPLVDNSLDLPAVTGQPVFTGPDEMYIKGGFKVGYYPEKQYQEVWGTLEREDTTPPNLTVILSPSTLWPPNGKLGSVTAVITVKDDYDPEPEIKLESITANETLEAEDIRDASFGTDDRNFKLRAERKGKEDDHKQTDRGTKQLGRIYTVTYSATDASGNKSTASATVTVPHDQEEKEKAEDKNKGKQDR